MRRPDRQNNVLVLAPGDGENRFRPGWIAKVQELTERGQDL
jgi:hypothetical protein